MKMTSIDINVSNFILSTFDKVFMAIVNNEYDEVVLGGGRISTKSQTVSEAILTGCMAHKASAACLVKYKNGIKDRLVDTFLSSLDILDREYQLQSGGVLTYDEDGEEEIVGGVENGISRYWKLKKSPYILIQLDAKGRETNSVIKFTGCDDPGKLKSFRTSSKKGFKYIWFEEATDFVGEFEINNIMDTLGRKKSTIIFSYNPPQSATNWVNVYFGETKQTRLKHHSTYLDVLKEHPEWLSESIIRRIEHYKNTNYEYYRSNYLGEVVGTDGNVFKNVVALKHKDYDASEIFKGLDFGFTNDPSAYVEWTYNKKEHAIYCHSEYVAKGVDNATLANTIREYNKHNFKVWGDSEDPRTINELNKLGLRVIGVRKGPDSVRHGIKWLQSLSAIYINPDTCPNTYREFTTYEYKKDRQGQYTGELSDKNNHTIDATRYALCMKINY